MNQLKILFRLEKIDVAKREVTGIATAELPDLAGEICDYETTKPLYQKWSDGIKKATGGKSLGNVREMHSHIAAGKVVNIEFDDNAKAIRIVTKCVDDSTWNKIQEGVLTGFSQGGDYAKRWKDTDSGLMRYTADPSEVSYVDLPCLPEGTFEVVKADGATEMRKFAPKPTNILPDLEQVWKAKDGSTHRTKAEAIKHNDLVDARALVAKTTEPMQNLIENIENALELGEQESPVLKTLLAKESWDAARAIEALQIIEGLMCGEEWEKMMGSAGEESQMTDLADAMSRLKAFIAAEIMEDEIAPDALAAAVKVELEKLRKEDMGMADGLMDHIHEIHKSAQHIMKKCMKCMGGEEAEKILKAEGGDDMMEHIKSIHKKASNIAHHAIQLGAKAEDGDAAGDGDDDGAEKFAKMQAHNSALEKALGNVMTQLTEIGKRLKTVEDQPAARKGKLISITKGHEREDQPAEEEPGAVETPSLNLNGLSPEEVRTRFSITQRR